MSAQPPASRSSSLPFAVGLLAALLSHPVSAQERAADDDPELSEVIVTGVLAPVPKVGDGAPYYTARDLEVVVEEAGKTLAYNEAGQKAILDCEDPSLPTSELLRARLLPYERGSDAATELANAAKAAQRATLEAMALRRRSSPTPATSDELEASELQRQAAVNAMRAAQAKVDAAKADLVLVQQLIREGVPYQEWDIRVAAERGARKPVPSRYAGLTVEKVSAHTGKDRKGEFLRVTGQVRNASDRSVRIPPLSLTAFDERGFPLLNQIASARGRIGAGLVTAFAVEMRPKPELSRSVEVTLAASDAPRMMSPPQLCYQRPTGMIPKDPSPAR